MHFPADTNSLGLLCHASPTIHGKDRGNYHTGRECLAILSHNEHMDWYCDKVVIFAAAMCLGCLWERASDVKRVTKEHIPTQAGRHQSVLFSAGEADLVRPSEGVIQVVCKLGGLVVAAGVVVDDSAQQPVAELLLEMGCLSLLHMCSPTLPGCEQSWNLHQDTLRLLCMLLEELWVLRH